MISSVHIQSQDFFGSRVGFLKLKAEATVNGKRVPGIIFMRGGAVAILVILVCEGERYVLFCRQPRVPIGSPGFAEIPAGMLDGDSNFTGVVAHEMEEETGLRVHGSELTDLTAEAFPDSRFQGAYPTAGGSDEFIRLYAMERTIARPELEAMRGKLMGLVEEGEQIHLELCPYDDAWKHTPDMKTLSALCLYEKLKARGSL